MRARAASWAGRLLRGVASGIVLGAAISSPAAAIVVTIDPDTFTTPSDFWDRWVYPFNGTPGTRGFAPTFAAFPDPPSDPPDFDNKDGQMALVFDTGTAGIPAGIGPDFYVVSSVRVTATHFSGTFAFDDTYDAWETYLDPGDPDYVADSDTGRPIELYGIGLRNGYTDLSLDALVPGAPDYEENDGFGLAGTQGVRHAYALGFGTPDPEDDVSNNVLHPTLASGFDTTPWAIGIADSAAVGANVAEGVPGVSVGETFTFDVDLSDPLILDYVQQGLSEGKLGFIIASMHATTVSGGTNPNFYTSDTFDPVAISPTIEIDYVLAPSIPTLPRAAHWALGLLVFALGSRMHREIEAAGSSWRPTPS